MGLRTCAASAVQITAPAEIGVSVGVCCFMSLLYVTPYRMSTIICLKFVTGSRIMSSCLGRNYHQRFSTTLRNRGQRVAK